MNPQFNTFLRVGTCFVVLSTSIAINSPTMAKTIQRTKEKKWETLTKSRSTFSPQNIPLLAQLSYLKASNSDRDDNFGSVAIDGDTIVVGAYAEASSADGINGDQSDNNAALSGAVYVFVRNEGSLTQQAYLKASNSEAGDGFGLSVEIKGDTIVVGAYGEDSAADGSNGDQSDNSAQNAGAVYIFTRNAGVWSQQAYLKASNSDAGDNFGGIVALSGDTLAVGAQGEASGADGINGDQSDNSILHAGAVYIFERIAEQWSQQAYIKASNSGFNDNFGTDLALDGKTLVVGAPFESSSADGVNGDQSDNSASFAGAAYVFVRNASQWEQQAYLKASNSEAGDRFGTSSIDGDTIVVGAISEASAADGVDGDQNDNNAPFSGAAYVFVRIAGVWSQQAYLKASNSEIGYLFGGNAIAGDTIFVAALEEASNADGVNGDQNDRSADKAGAVYVFERNAGKWNQQAYLKSSNSEENDNFGSFGIAVAGDTVVVGAKSESSNADSVGGDQNDNSAPSAGATYVFTYYSSSATQSTYLPIVLR